MKRVFADTSFFVALISRRDSHHVLAHELGTKYRGRILSTQWVLVEVANFFAESKRRATATEFINALLYDTETEIVSVTVQAFQDGWNLYQARVDQSWSLTDCISFNVMRERGLEGALSSDHHFEQAGFRILLK